MKITRPVRSTTEITRALADLAWAGKRATPEYQALREERAALFRQAREALPAEDRARIMLHDWAQSPDDMVVPAGIARAVALYFNHEAASAVEACQRAGVAL